MKALTDTTRLMVDMFYTNCIKNLSKYYMPPEIYNSHIPGVVYCLCHISFCRYPRLFSESLHANTVDNGIKLRIYCHFDILSYVGAYTFSLVRRLIKNV